MELIWSSLAFLIIGNQESHELLWVIVGDLEPCKFKLGLTRTLKVDGWVSGLLGVDEVCDSLSVSFFKSFWVL